MSTSTRDILLGAAAGLAAGAGLAYLLRPCGRAGMRARNDPTGLAEYSVVYNDRSLNHMSKTFQKTMNEVNGLIKEVYNAEQGVLIPGSGTFGMEAVAREFGANQRCMIVRNGLFSFRWTQIFESCGILDVARTQVQPATPVEEGANPGYGPPKLETLKAQIAEFKPKVVFAPHVETSAGMIIPDAYIAELAAAVHAVGGILVLDCIASGCIWVDMKALGVDVLISAPQKGWSGPACMAMVALGQGALDRMGESEADPSGTFALSLRKWKGIMDTYLAGKHSYFTTPPTDAIFETGKAMQEAKKFGFAEIKAAQEDLGAKTRAMLAKHGMKSVAGEGFEAPGVVVAYAPKDKEGNPVSSMGGLFAGQGLQIAAGVPLKVDDRTSSQGPDFTTFRLGLFGIDKLYNIDRTVAILEAAVVNIQASL